MPGTFARSESGHLLVAAAVVAFLVGVLVGFLVAFLVGVLVGFLVAFLVGVLVGFLVI